MIEVFRLPDPRKDAELYRYHGSGRKKRLIVLWGVEKEAGSAIAPLKALEKMPNKGQGLEWKRWIWLLLLLLVVALLSLFFLLNRSKQTVPNSPETPTDLGGPVVVQAVSEPSPQKNTPQASNEGSISMETPPTPSGTPNSPETPTDLGGPVVVQPVSEPSPKKNTPQASDEESISTETSPTPSGTSILTETSPTPSGTSI